MRTEFSQTPEEFHAQEQRQAIETELQRPGILGLVNTILHDFAVPITPENQRTVAEVCLYHLREAIRDMDPGPKFITRNGYPWNERGRLASLIRATPESRTATEELLGTEPGTYPLPELFYVGVAVLTHRQFRKLKPEYWSSEGLPEDLKASWDYAVAEFTALTDGIAEVGGEPVA